MTAPPVVERYDVGGSGVSGLLVPAPEGRVVLFADVEEALQDRERFDWIRPIIEGDDDAVANHRTAALADGIAAGLRGRALVDFARTRDVS